MTPEQKEKLEQVAREWLHSIGFSHNALDLFKHHEGLAKLLAAQRAAVLEEVAELVERRALICKTNSESHLQDGVYTQARSWEGGWHECERIIGELRELAQEQRP